MSRFQSCAARFLLLVALLVGRVAARSSNLNISKAVPNKKHGGVSGGREKLHDWEHLGLKPPTTPADEDAEGRGRVKRCAMPEPTTEKILHDNQVVKEYVESRRRRKAQEEETLVVPTCFHVIRPENDRDDEYLNADMIQTQLDGLNLGFSSSSCCDPDLDWCDGECSLETNIRFAIALTDQSDSFALTGELAENANSPNACITRTLDDRWYNSEQSTPVDTEMRRSLRRGDAGVLNIFFKGGESGLLGVAQFPSSYATQSDTDAALVGDAYVLGGGDPTYGEGDTLTHEVGHWMGLFHTFQDGCTGGDRIGDTPAEKSPSFGCQVGRDTCPGQFGSDPVHNFMDYSDDHCLYEFTENQIIRMKAQYNLYRSGQRQVIAITSGVSTDSTDMVQYELQTYVLDAPPGTRVECSSSGRGDIDMYMRSGAPPVLSTFNLDCFSEGVNTSNEMCSILARDGLAYVSIYAYRSTNDVAVTCTAWFIEQATGMTSGIFSRSFDMVATEEKLFTLPMDDSNARVVCMLESADGTIEEDTTMMLRFDQPPDSLTSDFDCITSGAGTCSVQNPGDASVLWAAVTTSSGANDLSIGCFTSVPDPQITLSPNVPSDIFSLEAFETQSFVLSPPPGAVVTCQATKSSGSGNMFLRWNSEPDLSSGEHDCSVFDLSRSCTVTDTGFATPKLFVTVETFADGLLDAEIECTVGFNTLSLQNGIPTEPFALSDRALGKFELQISRGDNVTCSLTADDPATDSVDLFLNFDAPLIEGAICGSLSFTGNEECTVANTGTSTELYIVVQHLGLPATGIILTCTISSPITEEVVDAIELVDGVPSDSFSLGENEAESFTLIVEPGARTTCNTNGLDGDADLYVRYNEESDLSAGLYDCSGVNFNSTETCTVRDVGSGGTLWATVVAFSAFTDLTITCTSELLGPPISLDDGVASGPYSLVQSETLDLNLVVEPGERVMCTTTGEGGDTDLILSLGQEVDILNFVYDCYSETFSSEETCAVVVPDRVSVLWVALLGFSATDNVFVTCTRMEPVPPPPPIGLTDGSSSDPISLEVGLSQSYTYPVVPQTRVTCRLETATLLSLGDADLYLRFDEAPDVQSFVYDCVSADTDSQEACSLDVPEGVSTIWATIQAYSMFEDVFITCSSEDKVALIQLVDGQPSAPLSLPTDSTQLFQLTAPAGTNVICQTELLQEDALADADLYVGIDAEPDLDQSVHDCSSLSLGSVETCTLSELSPGSTLFVTILAFAQFSDLILTCSSYSDGSVEAPLVLPSGVASDAIQLGINQVQDFTFEITGLRDASCSLAGASGDADLFVRWSEPPVLDERFPLYDCSSEGPTSVESCDVINPGDATTLWARVVAFQGFDDVEITCSAVSLATPAPVDEGGQEPSPAPITDGAPVDNTPAPVDSTVLQPSPAPITGAPVETTPAPVEDGGETAAPSEESSSTRLMSSCPLAVLSTIVICFYKVML